MWIWDLPAHVFERLILKVCSLKVHLSVADAEGSLLTRAVRRQSAPLSQHVVWDGVVGGEEERRQQEKPRTVRGKWA